MRKESKIPFHIKKLIKERPVNWVIYRVWAAGRDPLFDIKYKWSVGDLVEAHRALEIEQAWREELEP